MEQHKNVFIAVGSTAINGLMQLLVRIREDGIYAKASDDIFIGIDSDQKLLNELKRLDANATKQRIFGVQVQMAEHSPEHEVVSHFVKQWKNTGGIHLGGVGGQKWLSYTTLNWTKFWDDYEIDKVIGKGDYVILMGTAFGGTSTGMFWNLSEVIQHRIVMRCRMIPERTGGEIRFYALCLTPESRPIPSERYEHGSQNLCSFLRDMQENSWRSVLCKKLKDEERVFAMPVYSGWNKGQKDYLPIYNLDDYCCAFESTLPFDMLFLLPTTDKGQGRSKYYYAEIAFTLFYLGLASRIPEATVDLSGTAKGTKAMMGGVNMIVARSACNTILKNRYYDLLEQHWKAFWNNEATPDDQMVVKVANVIKDFYSDSGNDQSSLENFMNEKTKVLDFISSSDIEKITTTELGERFKGFAVQCNNNAYTWPTFEQLLRKCRDIVSKQGSLDDGVDESIKSITLSALVVGYQKEFRDVKNRAEKVENILTSASENLTRAKKLLATRGKSKMAGLVGGNDAVRNEVMKKLIVFLKDLFEDYVDACRCRATLKTMPVVGDPQSMRANNDFSSKNELMKTLIESSRQESRGGVNEFIYEAKSDDIHFDLNAPAMNFTQLCMDFILAEDESGRVGCVKEGESRTVDSLRDEADKLVGNNPLSQLKTDMPLRNLNGYSSDVYKLKTCKDKTFEFCYVCGGKDNITWPTWGELTHESVFPTFNQYSKGAGETSTANLLINNEGKSGKKPPIESMVNENMFANVQGVWLGTLDMTLPTNEIVSRIFGKGNFRNEWEANSWNDEEINGATPTRMISLRNMVYLGCVIGAIEQKVGKIAKESNIDYNSARVSVAVPTKAREKSNFIIDVKDEKPEEIGFNSSFILEKVQLEWIGKLMGWLNDKVSGFVNDFDLGVDSIDRKLLFEKQCLTKLQMEIPPEMLEEIIGLYDKILDYIQVKVEAK